MAVTSGSSTVSSPPSRESWITGFRAGICDFEDSECWATGRGRISAPRRMQRDDPVVWPAGNYVLAWFRGEPELKFESSRRQTVVNGRAIGLDFRGLGQNSHLFPVNVLPSSGEQSDDAPAFTLANALTDLRAHRDTVEIVHLCDDAPTELVDALSQLAARLLTITVTSRCPEYEQEATQPNCWRQAKAVLERLNRLRDRIGALEIVGYGKLPAEVLAPVGTLTALRFLWLNVDGLDRSGARHIGRLASLRTLVLRGGLKYRSVENGTWRYKLPSGPRMALEPGTLESIANLRSLRSLDLGSTAVTKSDLHHLASLTGLVELHLDFCPGIDDEALRELAPLRSLRHLNLDNTRVKGPGLAHLEGLPLLDVLSLRDLGLIPQAFELLGRLVRLRSLNLRGSGQYQPPNSPNTQYLPPLALVPIGRLTELQFLDLVLQLKHAPKAEEIAAIGRLLKLEYLALSGLEPGADLAPLERLTRLTYLNLGSASPPGGHLHAIAKLQALETLAIRNATLDLSALGNLKKLRRLRLYVTTPKARTLPTLSSSPRLTHLSLVGSSVQSKDVAPLARLPSLRYLELRDTHVGDRAILPFLQAKGLRYLDLTGTAVSRKTFGALRRGLPGCVLAN